MRYHVLIVDDEIMLANMTAEYFNAFDERKVGELQSPHYSNNIIKSSYQEGFTVFAENYEGVSDVSVVNHYLVLGTWNMKSGTAGGTILVFDADEAREASFQKLVWIDEVEVEGVNKVRLPINFRSDGFRSGERISLEVNETVYEFTICGFYEDAAMGASTMGVNAIYVDGESFRSLKKDDNFAEYQNLQIRFDKSERATDFETAFQKEFNLLTNEQFVVTYQFSKLAALTFINMMLMILFAFSLIVLLIAFIVARFGIRNSMQEDILTIGALKSIGYKNKTLRGSQLLQYLLIATLGGFLGSLASFFTFGFLGDVIASTSGILWVNGIRVLPVLLTVLLVLGLTYATIHMATRKYKMITPVNALRQGESHHSFKKNPMPLHKHKLPLTLHLGVKRFFRGRKNNVTVFLVASLLVYVSVFVCSMCYNLKCDTTAMVQMIGLEMAQLWVQPNPGADIYVINQELRLQEEVESTLLAGSVPCSLDGYESYARCVEDYSALKTSTILKGRHPELYNEIALGAAVAKAVGKGLGDTVTLTIRGEERGYLVVGVTQDIGNGGAYSEVTVEAMGKQHGGFKMDVIYVYLMEDADVADYTKRLNDRFGNQILTADVTEQMDTILNSMGNPLAILSVLMIVVTVIVIGFVLFLVIGTLIRRDKRELGILKAIGYRNRQLAMQIVLSLLPSLLLGSAVGVLLGFALTNPLMSIFLSAAGLLSAYFIIPVLPAIGIGLGIFAASVAMTYFISLRLKRISPQKLIVE